MIDLKYYFQLICTIPEYLEMLDAMRMQQNSKLVRKVRLSILAEIQNSEIEIDKEVTRKSYISRHLAKYFEQEGEQWQPYTDYQEEPRQVSQLKKILNALYHAEKSLEYIEDYYIYKPKSWPFLMPKLLKTTHHTYEAMDLASHVDINFSNMLEHQLAPLTPLISKLQQLMPEEGLVDREQVNAFISDKLSLDKSTLAHQAGGAVGTIIEQFKPREQFDFSVIAKLTTELPSYIEAARQKVNLLGAGQHQLEDPIVEQDINALRLKANNLLDAIKQLQNNSFYNVANIIHIASIIRELISTFNAITYQLKNFNQSSHKLIKEWLKILKIDFISQIVVIADGIEQALILEPGTISQPLLTALNGYYQSLVSQLSFVDFKDDALGTEVLELIDDDFTELRIEGVYTRLERCNRDKIILSQKAYAVTEFFKLFQAHATSQLAEMPLTVKSKLKDYYKGCQSFFVEIDPDLDAAIVSYLNQQRRADATTIGGKLHWQMVRIKNYATGSTGWFDVNAQINAIEQKVKQRLEKDIKTVDFRVVLNGALVKAIEGQQQSHEKESTTAEDGDLYRLQNYDQQNGGLYHFSGDLLEKDYDELKSIHSSTNLAIRRLNKAAFAYRDFIFYLDGLEQVDMSELSAQQKQHGRRLYRQFQPFIGELLGEYGQHIDDVVVTALNPDNEHPLSSLVDKRYFKEKVSTLLINRIQQYKSQLCHQKNQIEARLPKVYVQQLKLETLKAGTDPERRNYLIKTKVGSETIQKIRAKFNDYLSYLNVHVVGEIKPSPRGLPFPELELEAKTYQVPSQIIAIKRVSNILFYAEEALGYLESLNDKSLKTVYVTHILKSNKQLFRAYQMLDKLGNDPYIHHLKNSISMTLMDIKHSLSQEDVAQDVDMTGLTLSEPASYQNKVNQMIQFFYLPPDFINGAEQADSEEKQQQVQQAAQMAQKINRLIDAANHWTKYLFCVPEAFQILSELSLKFSTLRQKGYQELKQHLPELKSALMLEFLAKGDLAEKQFCLEPGTITKELQQILELMLKGMVESMDLTDNERFSLLNKPDHLDKRIERVESAYQQLNKNVAYCVNTLEDLKQLASSLYEIEWGRRMLGIDPMRKLAQSRQSFKDTFAKCKPLLSMFDSSLMSLEVDDVTKLSATTLSSIKRAIAEQEKLITSKHVAFNLDMRLEQSKMAYLEGIKVQAMQQFNEKLNSYVVEKYDEVLSKSMGSVSNMTLMQLDYETLLSKYMATQRQRILKQAKTNVDEIDVVIRHEVNLCQQAFNDNYLQSYQTLNDALQLMITYHQRLRSELSQIENKASINDKLRLLTKLQSVINERQLSPQQRVLELTKLIDNTEHIDILSEHVNYATFSFKWFNSWLVSLFNLLGLRLRAEDQIVDKIHEGYAHLHQQPATFFAPTEQRSDNELQSVTEGQEKGVTPTPSNETLAF